MFTYTEHRMQRIKIWNPHPSSSLSRKELPSYQMIKTKALHGMPVLLDRLKFTEVYIQ
jgi:hypothetical protein